MIEQTKEPGAPGEPLYLDVVTSLSQAVAGGARDTMPRVVGGRYGLASKDFNPAMAKAVFDDLAQPAPRNGFTIGIDDDVSHTSLADDRSFTIDPPDVVRAVFYGLGADGTVGANKNSVKIIAEDAGLYAQGTSSTTRTSRARRRYRTCASGRGRSERPTSSVRRTSWRSTGSTSSSGWTCCGSQRRGGTLLLNAPIGPTRCGRTCRVRRSGRSSTGGFASSPSTPRR